MNWSPHHILYKEPDFFYADSMLYFSQGIRFVLVLCCSASIHPWSDIHGESFLFMQAGKPVSTNVGGWLLLCTRAGHQAAKWWIAAVHANSISSSNWCCIAQDKVRRGAYLTQEDERAMCELEDRLEALDMEIDYKGQVRRRMPSIRTCLCVKSWRFDVLWSCWFTFFGMYGCNASVRIDLHLIECLVLCSEDIHANSATVHEWVWNASCRMCIALVYTRRIFSNQNGTNQKESTIWDFASKHADFPGLGQTGRFEIDANRIESHIFLLDCIRLAFRPSLIFGTRSRLPRARQAKTMTW